MQYFLNLKFQAQNLKVIGARCRVSGIRKKKEKSLILTPEH